MYEMRTRILYRYRYDRQKEHKQLFKYADMGAYELLP